MTMEKLFGVEGYASALMMFVMTVMYIRCIEWFMSLPQADLSTQHCVLLQP